ncbi:FAD-dependent oxidoreductase [Candidatus Leptofilum sp.]|uniref:FAD-dependent oxidoreductase n=1 Tax=Candidatus Leptofilum sp. TaxID=3241576 RepID=UPI003B5BE25B
MAKVIIVGDGPGGLSAALLLAKLDTEVTVFGVDETDMHKAMLYNYLGIPEMTGSEFQKVSRQQVASFGADLQKKLVTGIEKTADGFVVTTEGGEQHQSKYVILAEGKKVALSMELGLTQKAQNVPVKRGGYTDIEGLFVIGRSANILRSQAIISAGEGAATALEILSAESGKDVRDFDSV